MFAQTIRANISPVEQTELRQLCLITDGNAHRPDLLRTADMSSAHADVVSNTARKCSRKKPIGLPPASCC